MSDDTNFSGYNYGWEMLQAGNILSDLARGTSLHGHSKEELKETLAYFGISQGHFAIDAGAGMHHYILQENGVVLSVDRQIQQMNDINWKDNGYQTGDVFYVYGREYAVDEAGHIHISVENEFTSTEIKYPEKRK